MFQKVRKEEHEETLHHEIEMLAINNEKTNLQKVIMKINQHLIGRAKLQPQLKLHSFGKQIKQESDEERNNQRPKNKISTCTKWFDPQLWPLIQIVLGKHKNLTNVLHYL